jgi:D-alanyl-D-alanine carboxypeptidase
MTDTRACSFSIRAGLARALLAALLALGGLVAPAVGGVPAAAAPSAPVGASGGYDALLGSQLRGDLEAYLQARGAAEHVSAAGLSVSLPGHWSSVDVAAGTTTFGGSVPVRPDALWQIGSNTKAFTSVLLLQLEAEHRLSIDDPLGKWLPRYPQWADVTIRRLLNMTSGIPDYAEQPAFQVDYAADPHQYFTPQRLVAYAIGVAATSGYSYSNTNYVLAEMIIERATGDSYQHQLYCRLIEPLGLHDTYYRPDVYPASVTAREPAGYYFRHQAPPIDGLFGQDVSRTTLSWGRAAGGILATTSDMTRWERALYGEWLLPPAQRAELFSLVSMKTGQPIASTSPADPSGFGLGVEQATSPKFGTVWVYEGGTYGFRTLHVYFPDSGLILAMGLNSLPDEDQILALSESVYDTLVSDGIVQPQQAAA